MNTPICQVEREVDCDCGLLLPKKMVVHFVSIQEQLIRERERETWKYLERDFVGHEMAETRVC